MMRVVVVLLFVSLGVWAQATMPSRKRFDIKSGRVEYRLSGESLGTKNIWFDDYGNKYREELKSSQEVKVGKKTQTVETHSVSIFDGTYYYTLDLLAGTGTKTHKDAIPDYSILGSGLNAAESEQLGMDLMTALGGKIEKKSETVLGRTCDVTTAMGATVYSYKGVMLRSRAQMGKYEKLEEAVAFEENVSVAATLFVPPTQFAIEDVSVQVSGNDDFYADLEEASSSTYPSGLTFERFKGETDRVRRELGYGFAMHDAVDGEYASICSKAGGQSVLSFMAVSLSQATEKEARKSQMKLTPVVGGRYKMWYGQVDNRDEETGQNQRAAMLMVEMPDKDVLMHLSATPVMNREEMVSIFQKLSF